jgi:ketosteroid isomerase-like protein
VSEEDVDVVRGFMEHLLTTGEPRWSALHAIIEVHDHDNPDAGEYRGHPDVQRWLGDRASAWSQYSLEATDYVDAGDRVVVVLRLHAMGRGSGVTVQRHQGMVCTVRNGRIVRIDYHSSREQALKAVGLI